MTYPTLSVYPLFLGLTRPAMIFGVTQTFFILSFFPCMIFFMTTFHLIAALGLYSILHMLGFLCCLQDAFLFHVFLGKLELVCPNKRYWGCNSYDPA